MTGQGTEREKLESFRSRSNGDTARVAPVRNRTEISNCCTLRFASLTGAKAHLRPSRHAKANCRACVV
jgi:hypothetical protein